MGSQGDGTVQLLCRGEAGMAGCEEVLRRDFGLVTHHPTRDTPASTRPELAVAFA